MNSEALPFVPAPLNLRPEDLPAGKIRFLVYDPDRQIAVRRGDRSPLLTPADLPAAPTGELLSLGYLPSPAGLPGEPELLCFAGQIEPDGQARELPENLEWTQLRSFFADFSPGLPQILARGRHLLNWRAGSRFCVRCGGPLELHSRETAGSCGACGLIVYPQISPAIITVITRGDRVLLARNGNFQGGMYSLIAGFAEPGESLEQTVIREVWEEVRLELSEIRYYKSQPWPFPNSLMCGFVARCEQGDPVPDGVEIVDARWFSRDDLPEIPPRGSISRELIDLFINREIGV